MRKELSAALLNLANTQDSFVFLTGDLGFMAFEDLEKKMGEKFVNMGVSEQNMITVAASMAHDGWLPFVYSIAPFVICRPFEQIRNELGLHNQPVKIIGNGGGFGYGIMGSTHHCLEDIALMRSVKNMNVYVPTFTDDVIEVIAMMLVDKRPNYLRLNNSTTRPADVGPFSDFRKITDGTKAVVIGAGPVILNLVELNRSLNLDLEIWTLGIIPYTMFPSELVKKINQAQKVITIEEHFAAGGIGELLSSELLRNTNINKTGLTVLSLFAQGYISGNYGDQKWHQEENNLAGEPLKHSILHFLDDK